MNLRHSFVALAICAVLAHGMGIAWAAPMIPDVSAAETAMPCHGDAGQQEPSMPCCPEGQCDCALSCAGAALLGIPALSMPVLERDLTAPGAVRMAVLGPHRITPLKPPNAFSA